MSDIKTIGVIGAGTMGQGIVQVCAVNGYDVLVFDAAAGALDTAIARIDKLLARSVQKGKIEEAAHQAAMARISKCEDMAGFSAVDIAIEAATEKLDIKKQIFKQLDEIVPAGHILASNTSSISINELAGVTGRPDLFIGMHFFNPVPLMGLVEIITGDQTSSETVDAVAALARKVGKEPLLCKDSPGFVSNRVGMLMINEAAYCLHDGIAEPQAIDDIMKLGFNHPMGPLALADLIGVDVCLFIMEVLHRDFNADKYRPCPIFKQLVEQGKLGKKSGAGFYDYN